MHGGTSRQGRDHPNYKNGEYSKDLRKAMQTFKRVTQRPYEVRIEVYAEGFRETKARPWPERWFVLLDLDGPLGVPLGQQERILRAIRRKTSTRLREVRELLARKPREEE